ncbi:MAG: site-specific integrase [Ruminiclostridium sp.]|nr:site-specific integrase [Ruminiclostridium sp.]
MANIRKRGNSYQIRVSVGYDINGNQVSKTMTWKPDPGMTAKQADKEAQKQVALFEEKCLKGCTVASAKFEELAEQWFEGYVKLNLRKTTYTMLRSMRNRVYPAFGHLHIDKITSRQIQQFIDDLAVNGKSLQTGKPIARKTVIHHLSFISDVLGYAVKLGMISDNPCSRVSIPKGQKKEKQIYSLDEVKKLFCLVENEPMKYRVYFILSVYSGFRRGEMCGLEWKDVDWDGNVISVRRTSNYTKDSGVFKDTTKTKKSQRTLKFPQEVMDLLKELHASQEQQARNMGNLWVETDRLFTKDNGEPMCPNMPYKWLQGLCEKNGLPFYGIHSLRHINNMKTSLLKIRL